VEKTAYFAFSYGPYSCVGKHLAYMELCNVIAALTRAFDMEFDPKYCQLVYRVPVFCSVVYTPDPDHLADRRTSPTTIQLYQPYYLAILEYNYVF
jgi:hypothetical protein